jgi:hypothetical protein
MHIRNASSVLENERMLLIFPLVRKSAHRKSSCLLEIAASCSFSVHAASLNDFLY